MSNVQIVAKLSAKKVCGKIKKPEKKTVLMQIFGVATGTKSGESNFGGWVALTGQFRATNLETGEIYQSGICYLPNTALNLIIPMLAKDGVDGLEFAFNIGVIPADNAFGYEYYVEPMLEPKENDPLEMLAKRVSQVALPAPEKAKEKAGK